MGAGQKKKMYKLHGHGPKNASSEDSARIGVLCEVLLCT